MAKLSLDAKLKEQLREILAEIIEEHREGGHALKEQLGEKNLDELMEELREIEREGEYALKEAKLGDPTRLICRVVLRERLSLGESEFVEKALMATAGKRYAEKIRQRKQRRITQEVVALTIDGTKQEAAVEAVAHHHGVSRRQVFHALKASKKKVLRRWAEERVNARDYGYEEDRACPWCSTLTLVCTGDRLRCETCHETMDVSCAVPRDDVLIVDYERDDACPWCGKFTLMRYGDRLKCAACGTHACRAETGLEIAPET